MARVDPLVRIAKELIRNRDAQLAEIERRQDRRLNRVSRKLERQDRRLEREMRD